MLTKSHQHHIEKVVFLKSKLDKLYFHLIMQAFGLSMVSIFIPIYLITIGFSLTNALTYLLVQWAVFSICAPVAGLLMNKFGAKEIIILRTPLIIASLLLLSAMSIYPILKNYYLLFGALKGFASILYTLSITSLFVELMHASEKNKETGKFISLPKIGTILGPTIGAALAYSAGFPILFIIVSIILFSSIIPLSLIKQNNNHQLFEFKKFLLYFKKYKRIFWFIHPYGAKGLLAFSIIPIILYSTYQDLISLGLIITLISIISIVSAISLGNWLDKNNNSKIIKVGAIIGFIFFNLLAYFANTKYFLYLSFLSGLVFIFIEIPFESLMYNGAKKSKSIVSFLAFKEFSFIFGRVSVLLFLIYLTSQLDNSMYIGAISSLIFGLF